MRKHIFDVDVAIMCGVPSAVIFENIAYWVEKNKANEKHFYNEQYWTYNSKRAFAEMLPYLSPRQIEYSIDKLVECGLIVKANHSSNPYDKTMWYGLTKIGESIAQNSSIDCTNLWNRCNKIVESKTINKPYINNTDINHIYNIGNSDGIAQNTELDSNATKKNTRHKYGMYNNVLLTDEDYSKLISEFPNDYSERIEKLSEYMASTGKSYKSHLATIRAWARKEVPQGQSKTAQELNNFYRMAEEWAREKESGNGI